ncbi:hypothetical protein [Cellulomonas sp. URHD0024]|uniref:hypothetical protein n=1 Tax=Cellulomonas sp. URHD0024 TaxID=1302620 RepID=UPI0003FF391B|nr:hypothetical protein [Cellulomonas sp. URHD0024]
MDQVQLRLPEHVDGRNVLVVPRDTDVAALASAWFPSTSWARSPVAADSAAPRPMTGARFRGMVAEAPPSTAPGVLELAPGTTLEGPTALDVADAREAGLGARDVDLYALDSTDGSGVHVVYGWMSAAARRVGGSIVPVDRSRLVTPDPGAAIDLTLWSPLALTAQDALPLVRPAMSGARVGAPTQSESGVLAVTATFEYDGEITVRLARSNQIPVVLPTLEASAYGPWAYRVTWEPPDPDQLHSETPSQLHLIARSRVQSSVARIAAALWRGAGGTVVDSGGFVVTPGELSDKATAAR